MIPKVVCENCGHEIESSDKYCSSCGSNVEWKDAAPQTPQPRRPGSEKVGVAAGSGGGLMCGLCGQKNDAASSYCESCGGSLPLHTTLRKESSGEKPSPPAKLPPLKALQSWKLTLGLGIVLVATLVIIKSSRNDSPGSPGTPDAGAAHASGAAQEIKTLQQTVDANPRDAGSTLRLANLYHDVRLFPKAISMYERYLEIDPANADARVDLGTSYFELSFEDTTRKREYLGAAKDAMEKALSYVPRHQMALFIVGVIRIHTGEVEKALESFRSCVTVDSTSDVGRKALQFINQHSSIEPSS